MAIDYIDTTDKNEDRSDRLTLSHDAFMAHVAQCPPEDQERMNWLWDTCTMCSTGANPG